MRQIPALICAALYVFAVASAFAIDGESFDDPLLQERYLALTHELRCPKCQNQNIADSDAPIAADFRREVRALLAAGKTDKEIKQFLADRYGDFVLYRPPLAARTVFIWVAPGIALIGALVAVAVIVKRRARQPLDDSPDEQTEKGAP